MAAAEAFLLAAGLVFVAELGDKTQLLILAASLRGRAVPVLLGAVAAFALLTVLAAAVGALLGDALPTAAVLVAGGVLFVVLGVHSWRGAGEEEEDEGDGGGKESGEPRTPGRGRRAAGLVGTFLVVLVGELGDKTQLATVGLAAQGHPIATGAGALLALAASAAVAVVAGRWLRTRIRPRLVARLSGALFVVLGLASVAVGLARW